MTRRSEEREGVIMTGTGTGASGGQLRGLLKALGTRTTLLAVITVFIHFAQSSPINRQVGISENVYITVQNDTYGNEQRVCSIDSVTYEDGESIPTSSPCEHCICRPPGFACTIISCEYRPGCKALKRSNQCCPEYQCECEKDGKIYQNGEKILDNNNPCEVCYCQGGDVICAVIDCYWRSDCQPRYIENRCCPLYDHCPPPSQPGPMRPTQRPLSSTTTGVGTSVAWFNLSSSIFTNSSTPIAPVEFSTTTAASTSSATPAAVVVSSTSESENTPLVSVSAPAEDHDSLLVLPEVPEAPVQSQSSASTEPSIAVEIPVTPAYVPVQNEVPAIATGLPVQKPVNDYLLSSQASESPVPVETSEVSQVSTEESVSSSASPSVDKIYKPLPEEPVQTLPADSVAPAQSGLVHDSEPITQKDGTVQTDEVIKPELSPSESASVHDTSTSLISPVPLEVAPSPVQELPMVEGTPLSDLSATTEVEQLPVHVQSSSVDTLETESSTEKSTDVQLTESLETITASSVFTVPTSDSSVSSQSEIINPTVTASSAVEPTTLAPVAPADLADGLHVEQADVVTEHVVEQSSPVANPDVPSASNDEILPVQDDTSVTEKQQNELIPPIASVEASTTSVEIQKPNQPALPDVIPTPSNMLQPPYNQEETSQNEISGEEQKPVDGPLPIPPSSELLPPKISHEVFIPDTTLAPAELPAILSQTKLQDESAPSNANPEPQVVDNTHEPAQLEITSSNAEKINKPIVGELSPVEGSSENEVAVSGSDAVNDDVITASPVHNDEAVSVSSSAIPVESEIVNENDVSSTKASVAQLPEVETEPTVVQDQPAAQESSTEFPIASGPVELASPSTRKPSLAVEVTNAVPVDEISESLTTPQSDSTVSGIKENAGIDNDSVIAADEPQVSVSSTVSDISDDATESSLLNGSIGLADAAHVGVTDVNNLQEENTENLGNLEDQHDPIIDDNGEALGATTQQALSDEIGQGIQLQIVSNAANADDASDATTRQPELEILNDATQSSAAEKQKEITSVEDAIQSDDPVEPAATTVFSVQSDDALKGQEAVEEQPSQYLQSSAAEILSDPQVEQTTLIPVPQSAEEKKSEIPQLPSLSDLITGSKIALIKESAEATVQPETNNNVDEKKENLSSPTFSIFNDEPVVTTSATVGSEDVQFDDSENLSQNEQQQTTVNSIASYPKAQPEEHNDEPEVGTTSQSLMQDDVASKVVEVEFHSQGAEQEAVTANIVGEKIKLDSSESKFRLDPSVFSDTDLELSKEQSSLPEASNLESVPLTSTSTTTSEAVLNDEIVTTTAPVIDPRLSEVKVALAEDQIIFDDVPTRSSNQVIELKSESLVKGLHDNVEDATPAALADEAELDPTTEANRNNVEALQDNNVNIELTTTRVFLGLERADLEFDDDDEVVAVTQQPVAQPKRDNSDIEVEVSPSKSETDTDLAKPTEAVLNSERADETEQTTTENTVLLRHHLPGHEGYYLEEETTKLPQEHIRAEVKSGTSEEKILSGTEGQVQTGSLDSETVSPVAEKEGRDDIGSTTSAAENFDEPASTVLPSDLKSVDLEVLHDENENDADLSVTTNEPRLRNIAEGEEAAADDVATTLASVYTREDSTSSYLVDNEDKINKTQVQPSRYVASNVIIPSELVRRLDPITDDLGDNGLGRSDLSLQSQMKDEVNNADETWYWRAVNRIRQLPDFLPTLTRQPRAAPSNKPELVKPNKTKKATDSVPKKHLPIGSRFILW